MLYLLLKLDIKIVRDLLQKIDQTANDEILPPLRNFIDFFNCNCIIGILPIPKFTLAKNKLGNNIADIFFKHLLIMYVISQILWINRNQRGRTRREGEHEGRKCDEQYHLSLLPQGTFLATWLYKVRKTPNTRAEKCWTSPTNPGANLTPPAPKPSC